MTDAGLSFGNPPYPTAAASNFWAGCSVIGRAVAWVVVGIVFAVPVAVVQAAASGGNADEHLSIYSVLYGLITEGVFLWAALRWMRKSAGTPGRPAVPLSGAPRVVFVAAITASMVVYAVILAYALLTGGHAAAAETAQASPVMMIGRLIMTTCIAPICEELFFRERLWGGLERCWGALAASCVSSALFVALHLPGRGNALSTIAIMLPMAIALPLVRYFAGTVRASIVVHAAYNTAIVAAAIAYVALGWVKP